MGRTKWKNRSPEDKERILREQELAKDQAGADQDFREKYFKRYNEIITEGNIPIHCSKCGEYTYSHKYIVIAHKEKGYPIVIGHCVDCGEECRHAIVIGMNMFGAMTLMAILTKLLREGRAIDKRRPSQERPK